MKKLKFISMLCMILLLVSACSKGESDVSVTPLPTDVPSVSGDATVTDTPTATPTPAENEVSTLADSFKGYPLPSEEYADYVVRNDKDYGFYIYGSETPPTSAEALQYADKVLLEDATFEVSDKASDFTDTDLIRVVIDSGDDVYTEVYSVRVLKGLILASSGYDTDVDVVLGETYTIDEGGEVPVSITPRTCVVYTGRTFASVDEETVQATYGLSKDSFLTEVSKVLTDQRLANVYINSQDAIVYINNLYSLNREAVPDAVWNEWVTAYKTHFAELETEDKESFDANVQAMGESYGIENFTVDDMIAIFVEQDIVSYGALYAFIKEQGIAEIDATRSSLFNDAYCLFYGVAEVDLDAQVLDYFEKACGLSVWLRTNLKGYEDNGLS